jgi:uncharacterized phage-associated protein
MNTSICKKATQAINYFARKKDGTINKMKSVKLIYFADRYHIRKYGRPVVGDIYFAMKLGPVGSNILNVANLSNTNLNSVCLKYAHEFLGYPKDDKKLQTIVSKKEVDLDLFSQTDIEAFETVFKEYGSEDQFELADISHEYPEWAKHEKEIKQGKRSVPMDYIDFFLNPSKTKSDIFKVPAENLAVAKDIYLEHKEVEALLA